MSTGCHCRERAQRLGRHRQETGRGNGHGSNERKVGGVGVGVIDGDEASRGEGEQRAAPEATAAAGSDWYTSQPWNTQSLPPFFFSLSLTADPDLPLWPGWWQRLWHWPVSWALMPQRRAHTVQCARACRSGRGESEPVNMTGVPSLTHWLV